MNSIVKNPIFRVCGIMAILYYGLFQNKHDPDGLSKRLAPGKIKSNLSEISEKSSYIINNVKKVKEIQKSLSLEDQKVQDEKDKKEAEDEKE